MKKRKLFVSSLYLSFYGKKELIFKEAEDFHDLQVGYCEDGYYKDYDDMGDIYLSYLKNEEEFIEIDDVFRLKCLIGRKFDSNDINMSMLDSDLDVIITNDYKDRYQCYYDSASSKVHVIYVENDIIVEVY